MEYGYDDTFGALSLPATGPEGDTVLLGLKADTEVYLRVRVDDDERSAAITRTTGPLPEGLPAIEVLTPADPILGAPYALLDWLDGGSGAGGAVVVDAEGDPVWWEIPATAPPLATHRTRDGRGVYFLTGDQQRPDETTLTRLSFDHSARVTLPCPGAHHDLVELPDGTFSVIATDTREWNGFPVVGDQIVSISPTAAPRQVWSTWDWRPDPGVPEDDDPDGTEWTHANGIAYDDAADRYFLSLYRITTVVGVDGATGGTLWELGGDASDFAFPDDGGFGGQHAPSVVPGGLLLFDNHNFMGTEPAARVVEYQLDADAHVATAAWQWTDPDEVLTTPTLGDAEPLWDGNVSTAWGTEGRAIVVGPDGEVRWDLKVEEGLILGRGDVFRSFYGEEPVTAG